MKKWRTIWPWNSTWTNNNRHYITFPPNSEKPIKAVICHFPADTPTEDICSSLEDWDVDVINVWQLTTCGMSMLEERVTYNYNKCLSPLTKCTDEQGRWACLLNEYWWNFFHSGLASACWKPGKAFVMAGDLPYGGPVMRAGAPAGCGAKLLSQWLAYSSDGGTGGPVKLLL
jgi:hypothetical protein